MNTIQLKNFLLAGVLLVLGVVYGFSFNLGLSSGALIYPIFFASLFTASMLIVAMLVQDKKTLVGIFLAAFLGAALMSVKIFSVNYLLAILASLAILILAGFRATSLADSSLKIDLGKIARGFVPMAVTSLAILASVIYTASFIGQEFTISRESFRGIVVPIEYMARGYVPNFSIDMSVPEVIRAVIEAHPPVELQGVSKEVKDQFLRESEGQIIAAISSTLQVNVSRNDSVFEALNRALNAQVKKIPTDFRGVALFSFGVLVFATIKGFGFIFYYPVLLMTWLLYKLLLKSGFIRITEEDTKREILTI